MFQKVLQLDVRASSIILDPYVTQWSREFPLTSLEGPSFHELDMFLGR